MPASLLLNQEGRKSWPRGYQPRGCALLRSAPGHDPAIIPPDLRIVTISYASVTSGDRLRQAAHIDHQYPSGSAGISSRVATPYTAAKAARSSTRMFRHPFS